MVVIASIVLLHNLWQQATRDDYAVLEYRNWGLWLFASVFLPLLAVLSSLLSTFSNYLSFYYLFGGYFVGVAIGLGYLSGMIELVQYVDEKSEIIASALLAVLSIAPIFLFYFATESGFVYTDVETLTGGGSLELWLKFFIGTFIAWTAIFCLLVIAGLLSIGSVLAVLTTILYLLEFIFRLPGIRKITPLGLRNRVQRYREKIAEYDEL